MRTFELYHLSLLPHKQGSIFAGRVSREAWLRTALSEGFVFPHRKREFHWVPQQSEADDIIGIVQRQTRHFRHDTPEQGGHEIVEQVWQGAVVLIDPTTHETGQRVAFEIDGDVGRPSPILNSLLRHVNRRPDSPYVIEVMPIFDGDSFWQFADKHNRTLRRITFDFVVPNMWGTKNNLDEELRDTGKDTGAQKVKVTLSGEDGIKTDSGRVKDAVNYGERGAASVTATALDGERFNSKDTTRQVKVDEIELEEANQSSGWRRLAGKILGRD